MKTLYNQNTNGSHKPLTFAKQSTLVAALIIAFSPLQIHSQECGTVVTSEIIEQQLALPPNLALPANEGRSLSGTIFNVPVSFHRVLRSDGTGGISYARMNQTLIDLNFHFEQVGIHFFRLLDGEEYYLHDIYSDHFYNNASTSLTTLRHEGPVPNTANIWFTQGTGICGISSFINGGVQGTIIEMACAGTPDRVSTIAHELGHYFHLFHTHETAFDEECPDGTNCLTAGDLLCSTPAEPILSGLVTDSCEYAGNITPPFACGVQAYAPQVENIMSYAIQVCTYLFTQEQIDKMLWSLVNERPSLLQYDSSDNDADGVIDVADNCPRIYNPLQIDADADGYGDICLHAHPLADRLISNAPLNVNFIGNSDVAIIDWSWDFGDGQTANEQSPSHPYTETGTYTVTLTASTADSTYVSSMTEKIYVVADTMELSSPIIGLGVDTVRVDILAKNTLPVQEFEIPLSWSGDFDLNFISVSTEGLRTNYFEVVETISVDPFNNRLALRLAASSDGSQPGLAPDSGVIASVYFTVSGAPSGKSLLLSMQPYSLYQPTYTTNKGEFTPEATLGSVTGEAFVCGDANTSGSVNVADVTFLVARIFSGGPGPVPNAAGDADGDGQVNVSDVTYLVARIFSGGPEPICP